MELKTPLALRLRLREGMCPIGASDISDWRVETQRLLEEEEDNDRIYQLFSTLSCC